GATLYHLVTGSPPFTGPQPEVTNAILNTPPVRPRAVRPEIPAALEGIILKCLEKKPADRYPNAAALAEDLQRFLAGGKPAAPGGAGGARGGGAGPPQPPAGGAGGAGRAGLGRRVRPGCRTLARAEAGRAARPARGDPQGTDRRPAGHAHRGEGAARVVRAT